MISKDAESVLVGSYLNVSALAQWIINQQKPVVILCAAWKNKFSLEDSVFAGCLAQKILASENFFTICDSANAAMDLWHLASPNLYSYILKAAQKERLRKNGLDDVIEYCHTLDQTEIIPVLSDYYLVKLNKQVGKPLINS
jgi:2-phosphosulfolactate phosphatase